MRETIELLAWLEWLLGDPHARRAYPAARLRELEAARERLWRDLEDC